MNTRVAAAVFALLVFTIVACATFAEPRTGAHPTPVATTPQIYTVGVSTDLGSDPFLYAVTILGAAAIGLVFFRPSARRL
ncbi:MAG TPA: hypothetical protein VIW24_22425 [Aldersonia sp.]